VPGPFWRGVWRARNRANAATAAAGKPAGRASAYRGYGQDTLETRKKPSPTPVFRTKLLATPSWRRCRCPEEHRLRPARRPRAGL